MQQWWFDINANSKSQFHILGTDGPSTFWKTVEKKWWDFILSEKKRRVSEYVNKVIKNLLSNALFKTLIEKWFIYHNDISKIKIFEQFFFLLETVHVTLIKISSA